jgi:hypothetical protein
MLGCKKIWLGTLMSVPYGLKFWLGTSLPCLNGCAAYAAEFNGSSHGAMGTLYRLIDRLQLLLMTAVRSASAVVGRGT